ncbi:MAG: hypothetical protein ACLFVS_06060 [Candidatus Acetothermia bacterium]
MLFSIKSLYFSYSRLNFFISISTSSSSEEVNLSQNFLENTEL